MKRPDAQLIKLTMKAAKNKPLFTPDFVRKAMDLPYFYFHDKYTHEYSFIQDTPDDEDSYLTSFVDELLYDEFVLSLKTNSKFTDSPATLNQHMGRIQTRFTNKNRNGSFRFAF